MVLNELYSQVISADPLDIFKKRFKGLGDDLGGVKDEMKALGGKLKGLFD
jgi:hypothetical protein